MFFSKEVLLLLSCFPTLSQEDKNIIHNTKVIILINLFISKYPNNTKKIFIKYIHINHSYPVITHLLPAE